MSTNAAEDDGKETTPEFPSKSQRKREAAALQTMGEKLVQLSSAQLDNLPLPENVREAVLAARGMHQHGARKRQLKLVGKLLRQIDSTPIGAALEDLEARQAAVIRRHRQLEELCQSLVAGDDAVLEDFLERYPSADRQHLRQLMRNAALEQERSRPPKSRRALFRYLRDLMSEYHRP